MDMTSLPDVILREMPDPLREVERSVANESLLLSRGHGSAPSDPEDLEAVLVSLSHWLVQTLPVELLAYWNPRQRKSHLLYLGPISDRQDLEGMVQGLVKGAVPRIRHWRQRQWFFHLWMGAPLDSWDRLLIVEKSGSLTSEECNLLIQEAARNFRNMLHPV
ncbi:MAG: hypothetical protein HQM00_01655 [Magnetococcales bacterium]|nr:hypothetical protein [Magnetococcales bacterium]